MAPEPQLLLCPSPGHPGKRVSTSITAAHSRRMWKGTGWHVMSGRAPGEWTSRAWSPSLLHLYQPKASAASPVTDVAGSRNVGLPASAPRLSAQASLAGQTLKGTWESIYTISAAREARQSPLAMTPHAQSTLGCWQLQPCRMGESQVPRSAFTSKQPLPPKARFHRTPWQCRYLQPV